MTILGAILELDFETVVAGHGPVGNRSHVEQTKRYLEHLIGTASSSSTPPNLDHIPAEYREWRGESIYFGMSSDYLELDIARAMMSGALDGDELNSPAIHAFLDGYRTQRDFPTGQIIRSLRMLWYMESSWWITENMDQHTVPPQRFAHEMDWLATHLEDLPAVVGRC